MEKNRYIFLFTCRVCKMSEVLQYRDGNIFFMNQECITCEQSANETIITDCETSRENNDRCVTQMHLRARPQFFSRRDPCKKYQSCLKRHENANVKSPLTLLY